MIRTIILGGLCWGPIILGSYHVYTVRLHICTLLWLSMQELRARASPTSRSCKVQLATGVVLGGDMLPSGKQVSKIGSQS